MFPAESVAIDEEEVSAMVDKLSSVCQIVAFGIEDLPNLKKSSYSFGNGVGQNLERGCT